ncbi:hypothetical protein [Nocardiopsis coralliicola]
MAKRNPRSWSSRAHSSTVLAGLCAGGALTWALVAGAALVSSPVPQAAAQPSAAGGPNTVADTAPSAVDAPTGRLQIQVSSEDRAYIQNLTCTGDAVDDSDLCRELAAVADELRAEESGGLFDEVPGGAVCEDDRVYGPGEAVISGEWDGEEVDTALTREDSCEEARWQRLRPLTDPME